MAIEWNSIPDYDSWGWDNYWDVAQWQEWYYALKDHFGAPTAAFIWNYAWKQQTMGANPLDARTFSASFRKFISDNNLNSYGDNPIANWVLKPIGSVFDAVSSTTESASGAITNTGKVIKYAVPIAGIVLLGIVGVSLYKKLNHK